MLLVKLHKEEKGAPVRESLAKYHILKKIFSSLYLFFWKKKE